MSRLPLPAGCELICRLVKSTH